MRGSDQRSGTLFSYVDLEARVGATIHCGRSGSSRMWRNRQMFIRPGTTRHAQLRPQRIRLARLTRRLDRVWTLVAGLDDIQEWKGAQRGGRIHWSYVGKTVAIEVAD
jgi:hypothetical protein